MNNPIGLLKREGVALDGVGVVGHLDLETLTELLHHGFGERAQAVKRLQFLFEEVVDVLAEEHPV